MGGGKKEEAEKETEKEGTAGQAGPGRTGRGEEAGKRSGYGEKTKLKTKEPNELLSIPEKGE